MRRREEPLVVGGPDRDQYAAILYEVRRDSAASPGQMSRVGLVDPHAQVGVGRVRKGDDLEALIVGVVVAAFGKR